MPDWDMSAVTDMVSVFHGASFFNQDLSKWDVSAVTDMWSMFHGASAFKHQLCGAAWVKSNARKTNMFTNSPGSISPTVCTTTAPEGDGHGLDEDGLPRGVCLFRARVYIRHLVIYWWCHLRLCVCARVRMLNLTLNPTNTTQSCFSVQTTVHRATPTHYHRVYYNITNRGLLPG